jgi:hypothetical protein
LFGSKGIVVEIKAHEVRGILYSSLLGRANVERLESFPVQGGKTPSAVEKLISAFPSDAAITLQLPGHLFMARNVTLPFSDRKKARKVLPFEMEGILPIPAEELLFDSLSSIPTEKGNSAMALAIPKKTISDYMALFPEGRRPVRVIPDLVSLLSLGMNIRENGTYGILNMEEDAASNVVISDGRPVMMRSAIITGPSIVEWVASTVKPIQNVGNKIERLYVTGVGAIHELPLQGVQILSLPRIIKCVNDKEWPQWATIAGGAVSASEFPWFNILGPGSERERLEKALMASSIGIAVLLALGTADLYLRYKTASQGLSRLKAESRRVFLSVIPDVKRVVKEDAQLKDAMNKNREMREALIGKPFPSYLDALKGVDRISMEHREINVREAVFEGNKLTISGDGTGISADGIKKIFSDIEGAREAALKEFIQGINPNNYKFRVELNL